MTIASNQIFAFTLTLALLGGTSTALATPILNDMNKETVLQLSETKITNGDDASRLQQRSAITPLDQISNAQQQGTVNDFIVFAAVKKNSGILPSRYTGTFHRPKLEEHRTCVVKRESNGQYNVVSSGGRYFGAYQMTKELGVGATWMMLPEHKKLLGPDVAKPLLAELRATPVNEWPRYWQDAAFSTIHNWERDRSGAHHWRGVRSPC